MAFNVKKCKVLHIGYNNVNHVYSMNGEDLQSVTKETDFDVTISSNLKPSKQGVSAVNKANITLGMIKCHVISKDKVTILNFIKVW